MTRAISDYVSERKYLCPRSIKYLISSSTNLKWSPITGLVIDDCKYID